MKNKFSPTELRVIACLIEKQISTPDQYPLSFNSLLNACNQKSNREPVLNLDEVALQAALDALVAKRLVHNVAGFNARVAKYQHRFCNSEFGELQFDPQELGVICELMLRGPQTPGELVITSYSIHYTKLYDAPALYVLGPGCQLQGLAGLGAKTGQLVAHAFGVEQFAGVGLAPAVQALTGILGIGGIHGLQGAEQALIVTVSGHDVSFRITSYNVCYTKLLRIFNTASFLRAATASAIRCTSARPTSTYSSRCSSISRIPRTTMGAVGRRRRQPDPVPRSLPGRFYSLAVSRP